MSLRRVEQLSRSYPERIPNSYLSNCEKGLLIPSLPKLITLSHIFGVSIQRFVDRLQLDQYDSQFAGDGGYEHLRALGIQLVREGRLGEAFAAFERALQAVEDEEDLECRVELRVDIATTLKKLGQLAQARDTLEETLGYEDLAVPMRIRCLTILAGVYREMGKLEVAKIFGREAVQRAEQASLTEVSAYARNNLGNIYFDADEIEPAMVEYEEAMKGMRAAEDDYGTATVASNLGNCYVRLRRFVTGMQYIRQGLELARAKSFRRVEAETLNSLASSFYGQEKAARARRLAEQSNAIARAEGYDDLVFLNSFVLWKLARANGAETETRKLARTLRYLRTRLQFALPEVQEFLELSRSTESDAPLATAAAENG